MHNREDEVTATVTEEAKARPRPPILKIKDDRPPRLFADELQELVERYQSSGADPVNLAHELNIMADILQYDAQEDAEYSMGHKVVK